MVIDLLIKKIKKLYRFIFQPQKIYIKEKYGIDLLPCPVCGELPVSTARIKKDGRVDILLSCKGKHIRVYENSSIITGTQPLDVDAFIASSLEHWNKKVEDMAKGLQDD